MEGGGCPLESVDQIVDRLDLAVAAKRHHVLARTRPFFRVRVTRETLNAGFPGPKHPHVDRVEIRTLAVVGDRPADDQHLRELRQSLENGIADPSADRVEEQVYTSGGKSREGARPGPARDGRDRRPRPVVP